MFEKDILIFHMNLKKYSFRELAELSGVGVMTIHDITSGRSKNPTINTLDKICKVLGIKVDELLI